MKEIRGEGDAWEFCKEDERRWEVWKVEKEDGKCSDIKDSGS